MNGVQTQLTWSSTPEPGVSMSQHNQTFLEVVARGVALVVDYGPLREGALYTVECGSKAFDVLYGLPGFTLDPQGSSSSHRLGKISIGVPHTGQAVGVVVIRAISLADDEFCVGDYKESVGGRILNERGEKQTSTPRPDYDIEILIMGSIGVGKTTVARLIEQALVDTRLDVRVDDQAKKALGKHWSKPIDKSTLSPRRVRIRSVDIGNG